MMTTLLCLCSPIISPLEHRCLAFLGVAAATCLDLPNAEVWNSGVIEIHFTVHPEMQMIAGQVERAVRTPTQGIFPGHLRVAHVSRDLPGLGVPQHHAIELQ